MFYKHDAMIVTILMNVYEHLKDDWDYLLVIVGDTGTGKSRFALQLLETWIKLILKKKVTKETAKFLASNYKDWMDNFDEMKAFDMNINDEGSVTLDSKDFMTRISKDLTKMFNIFRAKKYFSVIVLPSFFDLNKYFREKRLRGLIWVDKRGHYKFYTKVGIQYLNAYNERAVIKSMFRAKPFHQSSFPDYKGVMLKPYEEQKAKTMNELIKSVKDSINGEEKTSIVSVYYDEVVKLLNKGFTHKKIMDELGIGGSTINKIKAKWFQEKLNHKPKKKFK